MRNAYNIIPSSVLYVKNYAYTTLSSFSPTFTNVYIVCAITTTQTSQTIL